LPVLTEVIAPDPRLMKIVLYRDNLLACYVSVALALATGRWHRTDGSDARAGPERKIDFDWGRFFAFAGEQALTRRAVEAAMQRSHQSYLPISYEETLTKRGMERVWNFLNVPPILDEGVYRRTYERRLLDYFSDPAAVTRVARALGRPDWLEG
jgi:hypothetical protein